MKVDPKRIWMPGSALLKRWEAVKIRRQDLIKLVLKRSIPAYNVDYPDYDDENLKDVIMNITENNCHDDDENKLNHAISAEIDEYLFNFIDILNYEKKMEFNP